MLKTLQFMLLAALTMVCGNMFAQEEVTLKWEGAVGNDNLPTAMGSDITLAWDRGTATSSYAPKVSYGEIYFNNGNRVTIAGSSDAITITKIVFSFGSDGKATLVTCNASGLQESTEGITTSGRTTTWEGEANRLIFRNPSSDSNRRYIKKIEVTYSSTAGPVTLAPELAMTVNIADTYDMDANGVFVVNYENKGTAAAANAKLTLYVDDEENNSKTIGTLENGSSGMWNAKYNVTKFEAGEHTVKLALTADDCEPVEVEKTVTFTKKAPEAIFTITDVNAVTVPYNAESYSVVATLTNTSETVAGTNVKVELRKGISNVLATETVASLAANNNTQVTLTVNKDFFETGTKTYYLYVNDKYLTPVEVTFEEAPEVETKDLAITEILGTIELANTTNNVRVSVVNNGNVDINDAVVTLKAGETMLGTATVSATKNGGTGFCTIAVASEGLTAGELDVTATVAVEGDATPDDNTMTTTLTVNAAPVAEPTFSVTAENVTVPFGAESFEIKATVKNTSDMEAQGLTVKLLKGITEVETKTLNVILAAGAETTVTFTVYEIGEAGKTVMYYVQAGNNQADVTVTFEKQTDTPVVDMALTQIQGVTEINLKEENKMKVWYMNNGNVATTATISAKLNETTLEAQTVENVEAKGQGYVEFTLPVEGLTAGETAIFEATIAATDDNNAENNSLTKELTIVSGEAAPAAEIAINPISGYEVEAGEQTVTVGVTLFNNGEVDAKDVTVEVYKSYGDGLCEAQTVDVPAGENNYKMLTFTFNYTFEEGKSYEFTAYTGFVDANPDNQTQKFTLTCPAPMADVAVAKIADIEATTEEDVVIAATLKNSSNVDANDVKVGVYTFEGQEFQLQGIMQTVEVKAGEDTPVEFSLGKLEAGNYTFYVRITSEDANAQNNMQDVSVKVTEPVVPVVEVELTQVNLTNGHIDLAANGNSLSVWFENKGNVDADAVVNVTLNGTALEAQTVNVKAGKNGSASFILPTEGLVAGTKATVVATVTVEGNISEATSETKEYDIVDSSVATEPVFSVTADNVTVPFGATSFEIKATVKNTSEVVANGLTVKLLKGIEVVEETQNITLAAGEETEVTFTVVATDEAPFETGKTVTYYVQAPNAQAVVTVTFEEEAEAPNIDLAVTAIQGELSLDNETNSVTVFVENVGNVDVEKAILNISYLVGEEAKTQSGEISVKAGKNNWMTFQIPTSDLKAGEFTIKATVDVLNDELESLDANFDNNILEQTFNVTEVTVAEPTFSIVAEDITVPFGATSFEIVATITNTSEITANGLTVTLKKGITEVETKTLNVILAAGAETTVTFTVSEIGEAGTSATYYVQVANKVQDDVTVAFAEAPVEEVVDLAVTAISGTLSLENETNTLTVWIDNKGTADVENATVTLTNGEKVLGTGTVSAKAGTENNRCTITVATADLTVGEFVVTATVTAENDVDETNNSFSHTYTIAALAAKLSFTVAEVTTKVNASSFGVTVTVKNTGKGAAENVAVKVYDENSQELGTATIASIAAGGEENVTVTVNKTYTEAGTVKLQVWVAGVDGVKWVDMTVKDITNGIAAIRAKYGENVQIYSITGKKVNSVRKGNVYIINGKKVTVK